MSKKLTVPVDLTDELDLRLFLELLLARIAELEKIVEQLKS